MTKKEFLRRLKRGLSPLDRYERQRISDYYAEMIDDRIECGKTEEEAVEEIGSPETIARNTLSEAGIEAIEGESWLRKSDGKIKTVWIVLLIVGSPLWFGLACGLFGILIGLLGAAVGVIVGTVCACVGSAVGGLALDRALNFNRFDLARVDFLLHWFVFTHISTSRCRIYNHSRNGKDDARRKNHA